MNRRLKIVGVGLVLIFSSVAFAAPITWTGSADNTSWHLPGNWDLARVPAAGDAVTIPDVPGTSTVVFSTGTVTIQSLVCAEALTFTDGTLTVTTTAQSSKAVTLSGGILSGGTWTITDTGNALTIGAHSSNQLINVNVNGDLMLAVGDARVKLSGTTTFLNARLRGNGSSIGFAPGMTLTGDIFLEGPSAGIRIVEMNGSAGSLAIGASGSITIGADLGAGTTPQVGGSWWSGGAMTLNNGGLIASDVAGRSLAINSAAMTNSGTLRVSNGGSLAAGNSVSNWSSPGTLNVNSGTLDLNGTLSLTGATFMRTGGVVNLLGTLNNSSLTLNNSTGSWNLVGGTINGGTLAFADGQTLVIKAHGLNRLSGVAVSGDLFLAENDARIRLEGATTFNTLHMQGNGASVGFSPGSTLGGNIVIEGAAGGVRAVEMNGTNGTLTIPADKSIKTAAGLSTFATPRIGPAWWFGGTMTLVNSGTIGSDASAVVFQVSPSSLSGGGTYQALSGGILNVSGLNGAVSTVTLSGANAAVSLDGNYTLAQNVTINAGTALTLNGTWANNATLALNGGTLNLGGSFTLANLGTFNRSGGTVNLTGTLNNTSLTLNNATGSWNLLGGNVSGGTLAFANGQTLNIKAHPANRLTGVAVIGDLLLSEDSARVKIEGGTTFTTLRMQNNSTAVGFAPGSTLTGTIILEGAISGVRSIEMNGTGGTLTIAPGGAIKTAPGLSTSADIRIGPSWWFAGTMTLVNNGLISAETAAATTPMALTPVSWGAGTGTLQAVTGGQMTVNNLSGNVGSLLLSGTNSSMTLNGSYALNQGATIGAGSALTLNGTWSNSSTLTINGGTLNLAGTFTLSGLGSFVRTGGTINLTGTLNNTSLTLNNTTGTWNLAGGTINGGTLSFADAQSLAIKSFANNLLNGVTVNGDLFLIDDSARVRLDGATTFTTLHLQGPSTSVALAPGTTLGGNIIMDGVTAGLRAVESTVAGATFTIPVGKSIKNIPGAHPSAELHIGRGFWYQTTATLVNNGLISGEAAGSLVQMGPATLTNNGEIRALAGIVRVSKLSAPFAQLTNNGLMLVAPGALFDFTSSVLTQSAAGSTTVQIGGPSSTQYGRLIGTATSNLAGTLNLAVVNGFQPDVGDRFRLERFDSVAGTFATINGASISANRKFDITYGGQSVLAAVIVPGCETHIPCDLDCNGTVNQFDINPFVTALSSASQYALQYPACDRDCNTDANGNGSVNAFDIFGFLDCLVVQ